MREEMEYIGGVLDELEAIVNEASSVPMRRGRAIVDRADMLVMLDELRGAIPRELAEAEAIHRECEAIVAAAEEEAGRIVREAHERAESLVLGTDLYRRSQRRSGEVMDRAQRYAEEVSEGSEMYRERVMVQLENWFQDSLVSVGESRQELNDTTATRPPRREVQQQDPEEDGEDGRGWRASAG